MSVQAPPAYFGSYFPIRAYVQRVNAAAGSARATSWYRTPRENVRVGGSGPRGFGAGGPASQHLVGLASDWKTPNTAGLARAFRNVGLIAVDEFDHVHVQAWPRGTLDRVLGWV